MLVCLIYVVGASNIIVRSAHITDSLMRKQMKFINIIPDIIIVLFIVYSITKIEKGGIKNL